MTGVDSYIQEAEQRTQAGADDDFGG